jgi:hypothetical protein
MAALLHEGILDTHPSFRAISGWNRNGLRENPFSLGGVDFLRPKQKPTKKRSSVATENQSSISEKRLLQRSDPVERGKLDLLFLE